MTAPFRRLQERIKTRTASGARVVDAPGRAPREQFSQTRLGRVTDSGPTGEPDYTDERYWVETNVIGPIGNREEKVDIVSLPGSHPRWDIVTATNLAERNTETHALPVGTIVDFGVRVEYPDRRAAVPKRVFTFFSPIVSGARMQCRLVSVFDDTLEVVPWPLKDGIPGRQQVFEIARPYMLRRHPFDGQSRNGISYNYLGAQERVAEFQGKQYGEEVTPSYWENSGKANDPDGDYLYAVTANALDLPPGKEHVTMMDDNSNGRYWAKVADA